MQVAARGTIDVERARVWERLWDVQKLIGYIPGVKEVKTLEEGKHYSALVSDRVGPLQVSFNLDIVVETVDAGGLLRAHVSGKDGRFASTLRQVVELRLEDAASGGTGLAVTADITLLGKLGSLGSGLIRSRATQVLSNFVTRLKQDLEAQPENDPASSTK